MLQLVELENIPSREYLHDQLSGLGNLISKVATGSHLDFGKFYVIGSENLLQQDIYDFQTAKSNLQCDVDIRDFIEIYINSDGGNSNNVIVEHWMAEPDKDALFNNPTQYYTPVDYYLSNNKVFYCIRRGSDQSEIWNICNKVAGAWASANVIIFVDFDLHNLEPKVNISEVIENTIINSMCMFSMPIYDDGSLLVWIKNSYDIQREELSQFISHC